MATEIKFELWMTQAFDLYRRNLAVLAVAGLIAGVLTVTTCFVLLGPMLAGLILITLRLRRGTDPKPEAGALFDGFKFFGQMLAYCVVWGIMCVLGRWVLGSFPFFLGNAMTSVGGIMLSTLLMFAPFLIVDRNMDFWPASMASIAAVKTNFWPLLSFSVVSQILSSIGIVAACFGLFVTIPFGICALAIAYEELLGPALGMPAELPAPPPSPPAEPGT
ncbi:MAG: hypothetical protein O3B24_01995 [Verrucomicrobia bacterium]|nr:hypothetical protein [Verrucomicrobiota bacterium]